jgi:hypothetical protein
MNDIPDDILALMHERAKHSNFTHEIHIRPESHDSDDIYWFDKDKKHVGSGFIAKDNPDKHICLTRCPACHKENYAMNVSSGLCTWCPFDANEGNKNGI